MKNTAKIAGIIASIALLVFSMTACGSISAGVAGLADTLGAMTPSTEWPSDETLEAQGLGGLTQPPDTTVVGAMKSMSTYQIVLTGDKAAFDNFASQLEGLGYSMIMEGEDEGTISKSYAKEDHEGLVTIGVNEEEGAVSISVMGL